jgi:hypothetical protein
MWGSTYRFHLHAAAAGMLALALGLPAALALGGTITDPVGDLLAPGHDITSVHSSLIGPNHDTLQISVAFAGPIFAPSTFHLNSLGGFVLLDTDGNANLAAALATIAANNHPPAAGIDFYLDLFSEEAYGGLADLLGAALNHVAAVPIAFGGSSFTVDIPVALIGTGNPDVGVIVGTFGNSASDVAALLSQPTAAPVPEPSSGLLFFALAGLAAGALGARRRW